VVTAAGVGDMRLALQRERRDLELGELGGAHGWVGVYGCMRHDLAVGVDPDGRVYRLGEELPTVHDDGKIRDRVFTPLAAHDDCDEAHPPKKIYAIVENDDALSTTMGNVYAQKVAPPPVPAVLTGVIGHGLGRPDLASRARGYYAQKLSLVADGLPLLAKGRRPGALWVALVTLALGVHGLLFCVLGAWWLVRRRRRALAAAVPQNEEEERFFSTDTIE